MQSLKSQIRSQKGSALLQALVYTALLAAVIVTALTFYTNQTQVAKSQLKFSSRDELRNSISAYIQIPEALHKSLINSSCASAIQTSQAAGTQKENTLMNCLPHAMGASAYSASSDPLYPGDAGWIGFELRSPFGTTVVAGTKANPILYDELGQVCVGADCPFRAYTMYRFLAAGVSGQPSVEVRFRLEPTNLAAETTIKAKAYEATNQMTIYQINKRGDPSKVALCTDSAGVVIPGMVRVTVVGDIASASLETDVCVPAIGTEVCGPNQFQTGLRADGTPICAGNKGACPTGYIMVGMTNSGGVSPACMDSRCNIKTVGGIGRFGFVSPDALSTVANGVSCIVIQPHPACEAPGFSSIKNSINDVGQLLCDTTISLPPTCPNPIPAPQTQVIACPAPQVGTITQERTFNCPPAPGAWGPYVDIASTCVLGIVNGLCGTAHLSITATAPVTNLCSSGTATAVAGTGPWTWTCNGSGGGSDQNCTASPTVITINGACGTSDGGTFATVPATNLCAQGTASGVAGVGPWTWTCNGTGPFATNASCAANILSVNGVCGTANGGTFAAAPATNLCGDGAIPAVAGSGPWSWTCPGSGTGLPSPLCTANVGVPLCDTTTTYTSIGLCEAAKGVGNCTNTNKYEVIEPTYWFPATSSNDSCTALLNTSCSYTGNMNNDNPPCCNPPVTAPCAVTNASVTCSATSFWKENCSGPPVAGVCGGANGGSYASAPASMLCADGATPVVSGSGPWTWTCPGTNGGASSPMCTATQTALLCPAAQYIEAHRLGTGPGCSTHGISNIPGLIPGGLTINMGSCTAAIVSNLTPGQYCIESTAYTLPTCTHTEWVGCLNAATPTPAPLCGTYMPTSSTLAGNFGFYSGTFNELNHRCSPPSPIAKTARIGGVATDGSQYYCEAGGYACLPGYNTTTPSASTPVPGTWQKIVDNISSYGAGFYYADCSSHTATVGESCTVEINSSLYQGINWADKANQSFIYCSAGDFLTIWSCVPN